MVAIFTGAGFGSEQGSARYLGSAGLIGNSQFGRNGKSLFLNAATGNLMIHQRDEYLVGLGPDARIGRTFNSVTYDGNGNIVKDGTVSARDENGDQWRQSTDRRISVANMNDVNTSNHTVIRVGADGSEVTYKYNGSEYVTENRTGANDTLSWDGSVWTWDDGDSQTTEVYGVAPNAGEYLITKVTNFAGKSVDFTYSGDKLQKVTTDGGEELRYTWSGDKITQIQTAYYENPTDTVLTTLKRVYYSYDLDGRLATVTVDMTPDDEIAPDAPGGTGATFTTTYTYDGTSDRVASISQSDGAAVSFTYDTYGRVTQIQQTADDSGTQTEYRTTTIDYFSTSETRITAPDGAQTSLFFDATTKKLTEVLAPPVTAGAARQSVTFSYNVDGRLEGVTNAAGDTNADGFTTSYQYDASGNVTQIKNALNEVTTRTYNANNQMVSETVTGSDASGANQSLTRYLVYQSNGALRYEISAEGRVTNHFVNASGLRASTREFVGAKYVVGANPPTFTEMNDWVANDADLSEVARSFYYHDARGQLTETRDYGSTTSAGHGQSTDGVHYTYFSYDQHGRLLSRNTRDQQSVVYAYDSLDRVVSSTDLNGETTTIAFDDGLMKTTVTTGSGLTTVSTYNEAGDVVDVTTSGGFVNGATNKTFYNSDGLVYMTEDSFQNRRYFLYDGNNRLTAELDDRLGLTRYYYDVNNRQIAQVRHWNRATHSVHNTEALLAVELGQKDHTITVADITPASNARDITSFTIYDEAGRVAQTILGDGSVTSMTYDEAGRVIKTVNHANKVDASTYLTSHPTGPVTPTADANKDQVVRNFYDGDGMLIGVLDSNGYLTTTTYDNGGRAIAKTRYANATVQADRASGSFNTLETGILKDAVNDQITRFVYDGQNQLRYTIDPDGRITERVYFGTSPNEAIGLERQIVQHAEAIDLNALVSATPGVSKPEELNYTEIKTAIDALPNASENRAHTRVFNDRGQLTFEIDALGHVTQRVYNEQGLVTKLVNFATTRVSSAIPSDGTMNSWAASNALNARIQRFYYTPLGQVRFSVDAKGYVTENTFDKNGNLYFTWEYSDVYAATDATTLTDLNTANKGTRYETKRTYNHNLEMANLTDRSGVWTNFNNALNRTVSATTVNPGDTATRVRVLHTNDAAGRTIQERAYRDVGMAGGIVTMSTTVFDGAGNVTSVTDARGHATTFTHDAMGRVLTQTSAENQITTYTYDGFGRVDTVEDALNGVVDTDYNRLGQITQVTDALSGTTSYNYGFFGNNVEITDSRGFKTVVFHDELGREVARVVQQTDSPSALGAVTKTEYNVFGEVARVRQHANRVLMTAVSIDTIPSPSESANDRITEYTYDANGRVETMTQKVHNGDDIVESYTYDQIGQMLTKTNALGGVTTYEYDGEGRVTKETLAATVGGSAIVNEFTYNAVGLLIKREEGTNQGVGNARVTEYTYDGMNRLETTTMQAVDVRNSALGSVTTGFVPTETLVYDDVGNVIERIDASGAKTIMWYDDVNRVTAQLVQTDAPGTTDPKGVVTTYTYDLNGNLKTETKHHVDSGVLMSTYATYSETAMDSFVSDEQRTVTYEYDALNRRTEIKLDSVVTAGFDANDDFVINATSQPVTAFEYDALGNLVKATDGNGNEVFSFFDAAGRKITEIDGEGYRTDWEYDALGNVTKETRFAEAHDLVASPLVVGTRPDPSSSQNADPLNRVTSFTYDTQGRRRTTTRENVSVVSGDGSQASPYAHSLQNATVTFAYNEMGQVKTRTEANGDITTYNYDVAGRLTSEVRQGFVDYEGTNTVAPTIQYEYDSYGNLTTTTQLGSGTNRVSTNAYDTAGRLSSVTDASGFVINYEYDAMGRVTVEHYDRLVTIGSAAVSEAVGYEYDALGRVLSKGVMIEDSVNAGNWTRTTGTMDVNSTEFNSFGDVASKSINGLKVEEFIYDAAGRLEATNSGDGIWKFFYFDKAGNETAILTSSGRDMSLTGTTRASIAALFSSDLDGTQVDGVVATLNDYNARGEGIRVEQPQRVIGLDPQNANIYQSLDKVLTFNAFGEVTSETLKDNANSSNDRLTSFTYDNQGNLIKIERPEVSIMAEDGTTSLGKPTDEMYYDIAGRMTVLKDANGGQIVRTILAGTGHGGSSAMLVSLKTADNQVTNFGYDRFGDQRQVTDAIGRITRMDYDAMGRMTAQNRYENATELAASNAFATDLFVFDGFGRQLRHSSPTMHGTNSNTQAQNTKYDEQGRVISQSRMGTRDTILTEYIWDASLQTGGLGTFGGWSETQTYLQNEDALSVVATTRMVRDSFGRQLEKYDMSVDLSVGTPVATATYDYSFAGWLSKSDGSGVDINYTHFNTGQMKDASGSTGVSGQLGFISKTAEYGYNAFGELTSEKFLVDETYESPGGVLHSLNRVYRDATVTYDGMGRVMTWNEAGSTNTLSETPASSVEFDYDAKGNIVRLESERFEISANGTAGTTVINEVQYNVYDKMDRLVIQGGELNAGTIEIGENGTFTAYDAVGRRAYIETGVLVPEQVVGGGALVIPAHLDLTRQRYTYDVHDRVSGIYLVDNGVMAYINNEWVYQGPSGTGSLRSDFTYNSSGMLKRQQDYSGLGTVVFDRTITYNLSDTGSRVEEDLTFTERSGGTYKSRSYDYSYTYDGEYYLGNVAKFRTEVDNLDDSEAAQIAETFYDYTKFDSLVQTATRYRPDQGVELTHATYTYEVWGDNQVLTEADIDDGRSRDVLYVTDLNGQTVRRYEASTSADKPTEFWYRFGGQEMGHISNNGSHNRLNIVDSIAERTRTPDNDDAFQFGQVRDHADFTQGLTVFNSYTAGGSAGSYTVQAGDNLRTVAARLWGDSGMWFKLAEANGLSADAVLTEGTSLYVPSGVQRNTFNANTFKPYNPAETIGDTSPTTPVQPKPQDNNDCGILGQVFLVVIAVAVTMLTQGAFTAAFGAIFGQGAIAGAAATIAGGMAAGAAGSIVSQAVGVATGLQDKFSWNNVALAAISAGNSASVAMSTTLNRVAQALLANALTQRAAMVLGWQSKFDWAGFAAAGVSASVKGQFQDRGWAKPLSGVNKDLSIGNFGRNAVMHSAAGLAGAATRSVVNGTPFRDNVRAAIPNIVGSVVGDMLTVFRQGGFEMPEPEDPLSIHQHASVNGSQAANQSPGSTHVPDGFSPYPLTTSQRALGLDVDTSRPHAGMPVDGVTQDDIFFWQRFEFSDIAFDYQQARDALAAARLAHTFGTLLSNSGLGPLEDIGQSMMDDAAIEIATHEPTVAALEPIYERLVSIQEAAIDYVLANGETFAKINGQNAGPVQGPGGVFASADEAAEDAMRLAFGVKKILGGMHERGGLIYEVGGDFKYTYYVGDWTDYVDGGTRLNVPRVLFDRHQGVIDALDGVDNSVIEGGNLVAIWHTHPRRWHPPSWLANSVSGTPNIQNTANLPQNADVMDRGWSLQDLKTLEAINLRRANIANPNQNNVDKTSATDIMSYLGGNDGSMWLTDQADVLAILTPVTHNGQTYANYHPQSLGHMPNRGPGYLETNAPNGQY